MTTQHYKFCILLWLEIVKEDSEIKLNYFQTLTDLFLQERKCYSKEQKNVTSTVIYRVSEKSAQFLIQ